MKHKNRRSKTEIENWKEVVSGFYDKSLALALLFILFAIIVSPKYQVKPYDIPLNNPIGIDWEPEPEPVIPKPDFEKPDVEILIETELETEPGEIPLVASIPKTVLDPWEEVEFPTSISQAKNTYFEDPPVTLKSVRPVYPQFYKTIGVEGTVILEAELLTDGTIGEVEVLKSVVSGEGGLDESAIAALKQWKFRPAKVNNQPVLIWIKVPFDFYLE